MGNASKGRLPGWVTLLLGTAAIVSLGIYMASGISAFMDIQLSDETKYLHGGMHFFERIPKGWGPSYSAWYRLLFFFEDDPVRLHYLNFKVLAVGLSLLVYYTLHRLKVAPLIAFYGGMCFLIAALNVETWPRISHFAAGIMLVTLLISTVLRTTYQKILLFLLAALAIAYARPEMGLSFSIIALALAGHVLYKRFRLVKWDYIATVAVIPIFFLLFSKLGVPILTAKGQPDMESGNYPRSVTAFGQHFYLNYTEWNDMERPNLFLWDIGFKEYYEVHPSLVKTLSTNIPITIKHITVNLWNYLKKGFGAVIGVFLPDRVLGVPLWLKLVLFLMALAGLIGISGWGGYRSRISDHLRTYGVEYAMIFALTIPPMISSVLIYPRDHYLMLQMPFFLLVLNLLVLIHLKLPMKPIAVLAGIAVLSLLMAVLMPRGDRFHHFDVWQDRSGPVNLSAIRAINAMETTDTFRIILNEGNIDTYIDNPGVSSVVGYVSLLGIPFNAAVDSLNVQMIYMTRMMIDDPFYMADSTYVNFLEDPSALDFERVDLATEYSYLLVRRPLLERSRR